MSDNNVLKRKNEDSESSTDDNLSKRVALDSEQLESSYKQEEEAKTAPVINSGNTEEYEPAAVESVPEPSETTEPKDEQGDQGDQDDQDDQDEEKSGDDEEIVPKYEEETAKPDKKHDESESRSPEEATSPKPDENTGPVSYDYEIDTNADPKPTDSTKPVSSVSHQRERDDPTTVSFRMYCPVKEAGSIVGKKGDKIKHIREKANVRINVSENLKGIPERIVLVRGSAENVAKAYGLIARAILDEPEDEASTMQSRLYDLRLLVPHPMVGFIIGKLGSKFREIEESSAAKLKAAETPLPYSTDRILSINGVSDAIHIAVYYVAQTWLEHRDVLQTQKTVLYNPANYQPNSNPSSTLTGLPSNGNQGMNNGNPNPNMNMNNMNNMNALSALNSLSNMMVPNNNMMMMGNNMNGPMNGPMNGMGNGPMGNNMNAPMGNNMNNMNNMNSPMGNNMNMQNPQSPYGQHKQPYNFQMMFQPSANPQQNYNNPRQPVNVAAPQSYTDEHGNLMVGEVLTHPPISLGTGDKYNQDLFVANHSIGSVIGKGGNNIKQIRESSGCTYVKIEHDKGQTMLLGGGKGLVNMRRLTLTGSINAINTAIFLINQRINTDQERNFQ